MFNVIPCNDVSMNNIMKRYYNNSTAQWRHNNVTIFHDDVLKAFRTKLGVNEIVAIVKRSIPNLSKIKMKLLILYPFSLIIRI